VLRLSILIPFLGDRDSLEATLASVLQNRPDGSEVVVALAREYDDPYQLDQEVRFVPAGGGLADALNEGFRACQAPIIHLLSCGASAREGWVDHALEHFRDRRIASVAPLIVDAEEPERVLAAGLEYHLGGTCRQRGRGTSADGAGEISEDLIGPSIAAGFYRRAALGEAHPLFDAALGPELADADLALRLCEAGYRTVCEPRSRVLQVRDKPTLAGGFASARRAERLFWRHAAAKGWRRSLGSHALGVARELASSLPHPRAATQIAARLLAACEWGYARRQGQRFALPLIDEQAGQRSDRPSSNRPGHRLDGPHSPSSVEAREKGTVLHRPREGAPSPPSGNRL
jgi:hypothetical protein